MNDEHCLPTALRCDGQATTYEKGLMIRRLRHMGHFRRPFLMEPISTPLLRERLAAVGEFRPRPCGAGRPYHRRRPARAGCQRQADSGPVGNGQQLRGALPGKSNTSIHWRGSTLNFRLPQLQAKRPAQTIMSGSIPAPHLTRALHRKVPAFPPGNACQSSHKCASHGC